MLTYRQVGNAQKGISTLGTLDGEQPEIVKQALEVVRLGDILGRKSILDYCGGLAVVHDLLDDRSVRAEPLVETDQMAELVVVRADVVVDHLIRGRSQGQVIADEIQYHIRVVHRLVQTLRRETVVIVPRLHQVDQIVHTILKTCLALVIGQHLPYLSLAKTYDSIKAVICRHVGSDIETAGHVVHRHWRYPSDKHALDRAIARSPFFQFVEEITEEARTVCQCLVMLLTHIGEDSVGEVIILVNEEIDREIQAFSLTDRVGQLLVSIWQTLHFLPEARIEETFVVVGKLPETSGTVIIKRADQLVRIWVHACEIEIQYKILSLLRGRMGADI